jgi:hypothetical protein
MAKAMLTMYFDAARAILNDGNAALVGFDVADAGVGMTFGAQFKPDSGVAKMLGEGGGTGSETLKQLPNQPYLMAAAMDLRTLGVAALMEKMATRLADPSVGWVGELIRGALPMMKSVKTMSQAYYVPTQIGFNSSLLNGVTVIDAGQGAAFRDAYRAYVAKMDQMKMNLGPMPGADGRVDPNAPPAIISVSAQYTDNALQVDGIAVDQYAINYTLPPQMMQQMGQAAGMMMMMGGTNQTGYLAVKDQYAIVTTAPDAQLVKAALASVKAGNGLSGQATIGQVNEHLTPKPSAVGYVSVSGIAQTVNQFMMVMGAGGGQPMLEVPADLPPVAFSMSVQDSGVAKRLFVPMPVISFASQTAQNMMGQMNAGEAEQPNNGGNAPPRQGPPPAPR